MESASLIITCKGRLHHLRQSLASFLAQAVRDVIVVDYGCPDGTFDWCASIEEPRLKCIRVRDGVEYFSLARARNIGARLSYSDVLVFCDADYLLPCGFVSRGLRLMQEHKWELCNPGTKTHHFGACFVSRATFHRIGGFDEVMEGWGYEDIDFYDRIKASTSAHGVMEHGITFIPHLDEESVRFHSNKDKMGAAERNLDRIRVPGRVVNPNGFGTALEPDLLRLGTSGMAATRIEGWMEPAELEWLAEQAAQSQVIVEIGTWLGRSTAALSEHTSGVVFSIDSSIGEEGARVPVGGVPQACRGNLCEWILKGKLFLIERDSRDAATLLAPLLEGPGADMVFIDGAHDMESVIRDINSYRPLLTHRGLLCGHDRNHAGVTEALRELVPAYRIGPNSIWWYREQ